MKFDRHDDVWEVTYIQRKDISDALWEFMQGKHRYTDRESKLNEHLYEMEELERDAIRENRPEIQKEVRKILIAMERDRVGYTAQVVNINHKK